MWFVKLLRYTHVYMQHSDVYTHIGMKSEPVKTKSGKYIYVDWHLFEKETNKYEISELKTEIGKMLKPFWSLALRHWTKC